MNHPSNISIKNEPISISTEKKTFRILQITDTHLFRMGPLDRLHLKKVKELCKIWDADLLVHTGDFFGYNGCSLKVVKKILSSMDKIVGEVVPWTFAWGNHDQCLKDKIDTPCNFDATEKHMEMLPNCLYRQSRQFFEEYPTSSETESIENNLFLGGNFLISLQEKESKKELWRFFILNTGGSGVAPQALNWMKNVSNPNSKKVPSLVFYHIPNFEYKILWDLGNCTGIKNEDVCHSKDDGMMHSIFKEIGCIEGCFVGHDHINDYYGVLDNIIYSYGRKTGTHGYGGKFQKENYNPKTKKIRQGGKLITLYIDEGTWSFKTVFDDASSWNESKKYKI